MPIKIDTYACEFRCGFVRVTKSAVKKHEINCFSNPKKRACRTCKHFETYLDSNGMEGSYKHEWMESHCNKNLQFPATDKNRNGLRSDCKGWLA